LRFDAVSEKLAGSGGVSTEVLFRLLGFSAGEKRRKIKGGFGLVKKPSKRLWQMAGSHFWMKHLLKRRMDEDWMRGKYWFE